MAGHSMTQRDARLDFMRALGTLTIIVPHVLSPDILVQIRTFDVVMLVFISGMSYAYQAGSGVVYEYGEYIKKRFKKLVLPTYVLIFIVFCSMNTVSLVLSKGLYFDVADLCSSLFLFEEGIGYVWIIKVYLGMAIVAPFLWKAVNRIENGILFFGLCGMVYLMYQYIYMLLQQVRSPIFSVILDEYIFYIVAYMIPFAIGMFFCKHKDRKTISLLFLFLFICIQLYVAFQKGGFSPNNYKYPPEIYYLSYGIVCSIVIYHIVPTRLNSVMACLSKNSLTFYLVHVFWVIWLSAIANSLQVQIMNLFYVKYILVVVLTGTTVLAIHKIQICYREYKDSK